MLTHQLIKRTIDLDKTIYREMLGNVFVSKDSKAHQFELTITRGSNALTLTEETVSATMVFLDHDITVESTDGGSIANGKAVFLMPESFYQFDGRFYLYIHVEHGTQRTTPFVAEGTMLLGETDLFYDPDSVIPSVTEILQQLDAARAATNAANAAAAAIEHLSISAVESPTVWALVSDTDGGKHIDLGLPRGAKGDTGESQPYNWLINSDFRNPVKLDSLTGATGAVYWLLGWKGDNSISTVEQGSGYFVTIGNTGGGYGGISQYIAPGTVSGKTMTMVVYMADGYTYSLTGQMTTALSASAPAGDGFIGLSYDSGAAAYRVRVFAPGGSSMNVKAVALYEGALTVMPPYEPKGGTDYIEMARQYIAKASGGAGYCTSTTAYIRIPIPVRMRTAPTVTNVALGDIRVAGKILAPLEVSFNGMDDNMVRVTVTYEGDASVINQPCVWTGSCALNAYVVP